MENIEIDISDEDFCILAKLAHKKDITFNELMNKILHDAMLKEYISAEEAQNKEGEICLK